MVLDRLSSDSVTRDVNTYFVSDTPLLCSTHADALATRNCEQFFAVQTRSYTVIISAKGEARRSKSRNRKFEGL